MRLTHGAMSSKCQSNSDMLKGERRRSDLYSALCITTQRQNIVDKCGVKYSLSTLYEQLNDVQCVKCTCVNEIGCLEKPSV